jgi:Glycosyl hydrolase family 3 N terminal domain
VAARSLRHYRLYIQSVPCVGTRDADATLHSIPDQLAASLVISWCMCYVLLCIHFLLTLLLQHSKRWLREMLRGELGFTGMLVTDYSEINNVYSWHGAASSVPDAVVRSCTVYAQNFANNRY